MANLSSPGVSVTVIDESFYTPSAPGTVPLIIVATAENKPNASGTGIAPGTLKASSGTAYLITSQKDLVDTFGNPAFKTDANNNPIHAGEQNEYGLQAAYSLLGVSNRAYVVRADLDINAINARASAPTSDPVNGTHWLDTVNSSWGVFEWNGAPRSVTGGQTFTKKIPIVITDITRVDSYTTTGSDEAPVPKSSIGAIGDYAVVSVSDLNTNFAGPDALYYKTPGNSAAGVTTGDWVKVGSSEWSASWPAVTALNTVNTGLTSGAGGLVINGTDVTGGWTNATTLASAITSQFSDQGITAVVRSNKLAIFVDTTKQGADSTSADAVIVSGTTGNLTALGITAGTYYGARTAIQPHTSIPEFKRTDAVVLGSGRPTGSVWVKTTEAGDGARLRVKRYDTEIDAFRDVEAPMFANNHSAIFFLDRSGGGANIPTGALYTQTNVSEAVGANVGGNLFPRLADFRTFRRSDIGPTTVRSEKIIDSSLSAGAKTFSIQESIRNQLALNAAVTVTFTAIGDATDDANAFATAINAAGFTNIQAEVDSQNRLVVSHRTGGEFRITDTSGAFSGVGFAAYNLINEQGTLNLYAAPSGDSNDFVATLWEPLRLTAGSSAPSTLTTDGTLWYTSVVDEVDMMIHNGTTWVGYQSSTSPFFNATPALKTDPDGPIVSATAPLLQSDGTALADGDLWIDTSDIENYPEIYKFDAFREDVPVASRWTLVDSSDQSSENGIVFGDARFNTSGVNSDEPGDIVDLLTSNYIDVDTPDPALFPKGMLLWNLRRSGFNVKRFVRNYVSLNEDNIRFNDESMGNYYPHRWVTESGNQDDGSGTFGRKAQRKVVVQALQALVNSNQEIRAEDQRVFNLIACPGYPELIGEMITLNYDRGLTAFVVGDTPFRLPSDATSLNNWGNNTALALEDNDLGAASFDEYMAMFYPAGFTSDNFGNNIVVPPSHMILRTIALSDNVSFPWFAPAGTRRGGITNATAVGYVDSQGEFDAVALNVGQRDTLYDVKINPITFLTGAGLVNYGQKTRARNASSLDRINVARLVIYLRRQLDVLAKPYVFEPNDKITRDEIKGAVESLLLELVGQRALYDYIVICDESNNTPSRIDRNELYVDVAIEPVKAVEFIYIPLRLKNTGEIAGL